MVDPARLEVEVVKAIRVPVTPAFLRGLLKRSAQVPEVEARLPAGSATLAIINTFFDANEEFETNEARQKFTADIIKNLGFLYENTDSEVNYSLITSPGYCPAPY